METRPDNSREVCVMNVIRDFTPEQLARRAEGLLERINANRSKMYELHVQTDTLVEEWRIVVNHWVERRKEVVEVINDPLL